MKNFITFLFVTQVLISQPIIAFTNFADTYPSVMQTLLGSDIYQGDRHGDFKEDLVAILSDGSAWKIHPDSGKLYLTWKAGDSIHIKARTDHYWFKREHKFLLYNHTRDESVKVMFVQHKTFPLQIIGTESYYKTTVPIYDKDNRLVSYAPAEPRKVLYLNDGSVWVIREKLDEFQTGMSIYIGAQGRKDAFYDFVLIIGDERDAKWTLARCPKLI